jgi:5-methylcytosine-specific restriction protein B
MWLCENDDQYCIIPVGADWTNREPLLGFPNALEAGKYVKPDNRVLDLIIEAKANSSKPYFLILDEMNLSHVERYFADFLSVMESHQDIFLHAGNESWSGVPSRITLPKNLFIIGTVNIDETTYMFSPKVLDRANVIEFRATAGEMGTFLNNNQPLNLDSLKKAGANMANSFVSIANDKSITAKNIQELNSTLITFFDELKKTGAEFGFRTASEILRFAAIINYIEPNWTIVEIIDAAIMQKLLPKVHGSRRKLEKFLKTLGELCLKDPKKIEEFFVVDKAINFRDEVIKYPLSFEKIIRMNQNLIHNGFTSYAEA